MIGGPRGLQGAPAMTPRGLDAAASQPVPGSLLLTAVGVWDGASGPLLLSAAGVGTGRLGFAASLSCACFPEP